MEDFKTLKVSGRSPVKETAGSIVKIYEGGQRNIELRAIGASSVNQAMKSIATARTIFAGKGLDLYVAPGFDNAVATACR